MKRFLERIIPYLGRILICEIIITLLIGITILVIKEAHVSVVVYSFIVGLVIAFITLIMFFIIYTLVCKISEKNET